MIVGLGTDLIDVHRVADVLARHGERFLDRCFTAAECAYCNEATSARERARRYAARFAAKEAASKALGTGIAGPIGWQMIEVGRIRGGPLDGCPTLTLHDGAKARANELGVTRLHLSLSHERDLAMAVVILEA